MTRSTSGAAVLAGAFLTLAAAGTARSSRPSLPVQPTIPPTPGDSVFRTADRCIACHKGVVTAQGMDVSIGYDWRASMMANSARDPYWQASVRREIMDHPEAREAIEEKCARCHMPMASVSAELSGGRGRVFANLPVGGDGEAALAADGVSCAVCHQIADQGLGTEDSFVGGFEISPESPPDGRPAYGPFDPDQGGIGIMHSATGLRPTQGPHVQTAELCATCHTLFTHALGPDGREGAEFPEQAPYLEWRASEYFPQGRSCQDCHMPEVEGEVPVTQVLGRGRPNVSRHVFRGGNFFMLRMLNRYRGELGVSALPQELALSADRTEDHLRTATASVSIEAVSLIADRLHARIRVQNEAGHKFPTAYPSRRAWLHVTVKDRAGRIVFESGRFEPDGRVEGNDNDRDGSVYEPHYREIREPDQVQVYEAVMVDQFGAVTTGLMSAERWVKDNRLLPGGFDAGRADPRIATYGGATDDADFSPGTDHIRYSVDIDGAARPFSVDVELWFQPIAYRWARNLEGYEAPETRRFVGYYDSMSATSALMISEDSRRVP